MTDYRTQPDGHLGTAQMRMLWTIARSLAADAAAKGRDVAAFQGFALCARRLAVSSAGACLVRVVVLYGFAAERALKGLPWEAEDELESFVVTLPAVQHKPCDDAVVVQAVETDGKSLRPSVCRTGKVRFIPPVSHATVPMMSATHSTLSVTIRKRLASGTNSA
jgi:hypothetical protein